MTKVKAPAIGLVIGVFAHQTIKPALDASSEALSSVDGEHTRGINDAGVEPVSQHELAR